MSAFLTVQGQPFEEGEYEALFVNMYDKDIITATEMADAIGFINQCRGFDFKSINVNDQNSPEVRKIYFVINISQPEFDRPLAVRFSLGQNICFFAVEAPPRLEEIANWKNHYRGDYPATISNGICIVNTSYDMDKLYKEIAKFIRKEHPMKMYQNIKLWWSEDRASAYIEKHLHKAKL